MRQKYKEKRKKASFILKRNIIEYFNKITQSEVHGNDVRMKK